MRRGRTVLVVLLIGVTASCSGSDEASSSEEPTSVAEPSAASGSADGQPSQTSETASPPSTTTIMPTAVFVDGPCPVEPASGLLVECGTVAVPEDRSRPDGNLIDLAVARVASTGAGRVAEPIVWISGGPGDALLDVLARSADNHGVLTNPLLGSHDLVFVDQRGIGASRPSLDCPDHDEAVWAMFGADRPFAEELELIRTSLDDCRAELTSRGVELNAYDTISVAADFDDVRRALGIERWGVYAVSYGTLVAQQLLRNFDDHITAAVLDSVVPVDRTDLDHHVQAHDAGLDVFFTSCETSPTCAARYPDLRGRFGALVTDYSADPLEITVADENGVDRDLTITGADLRSGVISALRSTDRLPNIPLFIELAEQRAPVVEAIFGQISTNLLAPAEAMRDAVNCRDRFHDITTGDLDALVETRPELATFALTQSWASCDIWNVGSVPDAFHEPVTTDTPTLVLAGSYDPQTPPADSRLVAERLGNATYIEFASVSHGVWRTNDCTNAITRDFFTDPTSPPDTSCLDELPSMTFTE